MRPKASPGMFDEMNSDSFTEFMNTYVVEIYGGAKGFTPGPPQGVDGGIDATTRGIDTEGRFQYKFHIYNGSDAEPKVLQDVPLRQFKEWLEETYPRYGGSGPYVFATNVMRNQSHIDKCQDIIDEYKKIGVEVHYIDHQQIVTFMNIRPERYLLWIPHYTGQGIGKNIEELKRLQNEAEVEKQRREKEAKKKYADTPEFDILSKKFSELIVDKTLVMRRYVGSIYLFYPIYVDDTDGSRSILRELFNITAPLESEIIDLLAAEQKIEVTGNIITASESNEATDAATEIVDFLGDDLQKVLKLLQRSE
jgi:hypothetical protein